MKRKILTLGLAITMSVNLVGCAGTSTPEQSGQQVPAVVTEDQPTEPKVTEPGEAQAPTSEAPQENRSLEPTVPGQTAPDTPVVPQSPDSNQVPAAADPQTPAKPTLPQGTISLQVGATLPEFVLADLKGNQVSGSSIITNHRLTFINFWTTT
ncbi:hypothetical protein [Desulforamulus ferrireducens]|uniref:Alkyl hydroperoxide reductase subunit C/ Thiol specific antioxidant domain-containing protein n=1 Tax=Desulforamulus ferrireducens TaxID=1833852 RepID=A0A1S6IVA1_9FIRM|nr:hypothetical protein [Desulforamulus ferrireducens]AQS58682.1 hypothetical protein B0537_06055 [Desulforamulus ferrireducens]